jgi:hypothetical protein
LVSAAGCGRALGVIGLGHSHQRGGNYRRVSNEQAKLYRRRYTGHRATGGKRRGYLARASNRGRIGTMGRGDSVNPRVCGGCQDVFVNAHDSGLCYWCLGTMIMVYRDYGVKLYEGVEL